jgi:hypothetical protein
MTFYVEQEGKKYRSIFVDENGMSVIYRGSKKKCEEYNKSQSKKLKNGGLVHTSATVWK